MVESSESTWDTVSPLHRLKEMLLTACDDTYLQEAKLLIRSCARHEPAHPFFLFLVNSKSEKDSTIRSWHPQIEIERATWPQDSETWRGTMSCARSIPIRKVLENCREPAIYLDSDVLLRGSIHNLFEILERVDLTVKHRPESKLAGPAGTPFAFNFNAGVIGLRPSQMGIRFARLFDDNIQEHLRAGKPVSLYHPNVRVEALVDQELLFATYLQLKDNLLFEALPLEFNDSKFDQKSIIWHGKGTARQHPLYRVEKARYRYSALYYPLTLLSSALSILRAVRRRLRKWSQD